jgi:hypothetical protein
MSITYDELVSLITSTLQPDDEATFISHIDDFIKQAEDTIIKNCQIPIMIAEATGTLSVGSGNINVPTDYIAPLKFEVTSGGVKTQLKMRNDSFLVSAYPENPAVQGLPIYFSNDSENASLHRLRYRPISDQTYSYTLEYSRRPASLAAGAGSGTTWISTNMRTALVSGSIMYAAIYSMKMDMANFYEKKFREAMGLTKVEQEGKARTDTHRKEYSRPPAQDDEE